MTPLALGIGIATTSLLCIFVSAKIMIGITVLQRKGIVLFPFRNTKNHE